MDGTPRFGRPEYTPESYRDVDPRRGGKLRDWGRRGKRYLAIYGIATTTKFTVQAVCSTYLARIRSATRFFKVDNEKFRYGPLYGINERIVEVPYFVQFIRRYESGKPRVLEVGNVLQHEVLYPRDVLDKYEVSSDIINEDAAIFTPSHLYDLIVSVSTLEHVGWDETSRDPRRSLVAIHNLYSNCLASGGHMLISAPLGYNPIIDDFFMTTAGSLGKIVYLERVSIFNDWVQVPFSGAWRFHGFPRYSSRYMAANVLGLWEASKGSAGPGSRDFSSQRRTDRGFDK